MVVAVELPVRLAEWVAEVLSEVDGVVDSDDDTEVLSLPLAELEADMVGEDVAVADAEVERVRDNVAEAVVDADADAVLEPVVDLVAEPLVVAVVDTVLLGDAVAVVVAVVAAVAETDELPEADAVLDAVDVCVEISHPLKSPILNSSIAELRPAVIAPQSDGSRAMYVPDIEQRNSLCGPVPPPRVSTMWSSRRP